MEWLEYRGSNGRYDFFSLIAMLLGRDITLMAYA